MSLTLTHKVKAFLILLFKHPRINPKTNEHFCKSMYYDFRNELHLFLYALMTTLANGRDLKTGSVSPWF